jgi:hypothetical protein
MAVPKGVSQKYDQIKGAIGFRNLTKVPLLKHGVALHIFCYRSFSSKAKKVAALVDAAKVHRWEAFGKVDAMSALATA